ADQSDDSVARGERHEGRPDANGQQAVMDEFRQAATYRRLPDSPHPAVVPHPYDQAPDHAAGPEVEEELPNRPGMRRLRRQPSHGEAHEGAREREAESEQRRGVVRPRAPGNRSAVVMPGHSTPPSPSPPYRSLRRTDWPPGLLSSPPRGHRAIVR